MFTDTCGERWEKEPVHLDLLFALPPPAITRTTNNVQPFDDRTRPRRVSILDSFSRRLKRIEPTVRVPVLGSQRV
jgi:hypothetical protein